MSIQLIDHNADLKKLKDEGFNISIINDHLVVQGIPYVNKDKEILFGTLYCPMNISGFNVGPPQDHTARFMGEHPCNQFGEEDGSYINSQQNHNFTEDIIGRYYLSAKPQNGNYPDFHAKITKYVNLLSAPAKSIDPDVSAQQFDYVEYNDTSIFKYPDTNTARAGLSHISNKLKGQKIAIVGLGGTGSYVLDFVSKTPVEQISLFDEDEMLKHNAFRMPGAMTLDELKNRPTKVAYYSEKYGGLRNGIVCHETFIDESNVTLLKNHDFVFLAVSESKEKKVIVNFLSTEKIPFVDLGMGVTELKDSLRGTLRKTLITQEDQSQFKKIPMEQTEDEDIYSRNIQISELNALNAIMGVIAWKKMSGFYITDEPKLNSLFIIDEERISHAP